jgi:23S rRNA (uridine2479-2'-O)-methyltransferase
LKTIPINTENAAYQELAALKTNRNKRKRMSLFLVESVQAIKMMLDGNRQARAVIVCRDRPLSGWARSAVESLRPETRYVLSETLMAGLSDREEPSELIVACDLVEKDLSELALTPSSVIVVIDRPSNPGNFGSIIRTSNALGIDAVVTTGHGVDIHDPAVIRSSLGAFFATPVIFEPSKEKLVQWIANRKATVPGLLVCGTDSKGDTALEAGSLSAPLILCVGNEATGLSSKLRETVDRVVSIRMRGKVDSLNVACAASIFLYEITRGRV